MSSLLVPAAPAARLIRPESCGKCKWSAPQPSGKGIECHGQPPTVFLVPGPGGQPMTMAAFAPVSPDHFCANWRAKVEIAAAGMAN